MKKSKGAKKRIALLTGGGDCPGINAVIRAVTKKAILDYGMEIIGIEDGYEGMIHNRHRRLEYDSVSGILTLGGTILGASKTANPYKYAIERDGRMKFVDVSKSAIRNLGKLDISGLVCIGGDGTLGIANRLFNDGVPVVGIPKTIDNDIRGTELSFGFDSAVAVATEGVDRIHTTAQSHHRIMIVEVMGHQTGWIALHSGVAGGGDIILIPEIPFDVDGVALKIAERHLKRRSFTIIVVAEGAKPKGGDVVVQRIVKESADPVRLGGVGFMVGEKLEEITGFETRTTVMGHLQRGGSPTAFDRVLATELGTRAVGMIEEESFGQMVGVKGSGFVKVPLSVVAEGPRIIPHNHRLVMAARGVGTYFGDDH